MHSILTYDPEQTPLPNVWLAADEQVRIDAVVRWHREARVELPNELLHAVVHVVVENQLAEELPSVVMAIPRLMRQGLTRHDAIHAVASVVTKHIFELQNSPQPPIDVATNHALYETAVDRLTADNWWSLADE